MLYLLLSYVLMVVTLKVIIIIFSGRKNVVEIKDTRKVYTFKVQKPDVIFTFEQHQAYIMLLCNANLQTFNKFAAKNLSIDERDEVLRHIKVSDLSNVY